MGDQRMVRVKRLPGEDGPLLTFLRDVRYAFTAFLAIPTVIVLLFLVLGGISVWLDHSRLDGVPILGPVRDFLEHWIYVSPDATASFLGTIAGSLMTVTSIILSLVLVAVQQSASSLTTQVFDQFLRRRINQVTIGFFIGLSLYSLIVLSTIGGMHNAVIGATIAFFLTGAAMFLLPALIYVTIQQIRPSGIIAAITDFTLAARRQQGSTLVRTRRVSCSEAPVVATIRASSHGFVDDLDLDCLERAIRETEGDLELELLVSLGTYVSNGDPLAEIRSQETIDAERLTRAMAQAIPLVAQRNIVKDPCYGLEQLVTIGWTTVSTAKGNPAPGIAVVRSLRRLIVEFLLPMADDELECEKPLPIVYRDNVPGDLLGALESLVVVSAESLQHQVVAEVIYALASTYPRLPKEKRTRLNRLVVRLLRLLSVHALTGQLNRALVRLAKAASQAGEDRIAEEVKAAHRRYAIAEQEPTAKEPSTNGDEDEEA